MTGERLECVDSIPNFFTRYLSCRNVIPSNSAAFVLLYRVCSSALTIASR
jgi:hypothetical protein